MAEFNTSTWRNMTVDLAGNGTSLPKPTTLMIDPKGALVIPAIMFALGVFGNGLAITSLLMYKYRRVRPHSPITCSSGMQPSPRLQREREGSVAEAAIDMQRRRSSAASRNKLEINPQTLRRRRKKTAFGPFHTLVLGLITVDLAGNLVTSPVTMLLYSTNRRITAVGGQALCNYSAFVMMYFGIVTMASLMTMAIERVLSIQYPYYYHRHVTPRRAFFVQLVVLVGCALFSALPSLGFGKVRTMFPGTWCFADWHAKESKDQAYNFLYATSGILMIFTTVICNVTVVVGLFKMKQRLKARTSRKNSLRRETQMIIQLICMTCIYLICWLPLMIRILDNQLTMKREGEKDRVAIWLAAVNPILDPWVYILLRRSVVKRLVHFAKSVCLSKLQDGIRRIIGYTPGKQPDFKDGASLRRSFDPIYSKPCTPRQTPALSSRHDVIHASMDSVYDNIPETLGLNPISHKMDSTRERESFNNVMIVNDK